MRNDNIKLNEGCLKIFKFLELLYNDDACYDKVIEIFKDEWDFSNQKNIKNIQVILNKYLNTLKVFGFKVKKENGKFRIKSSMYSVDFSKDDLRALKILQDSVENIPDTTLNENFETLLKNCKFLMNSDDKREYDSINDCPDFSFQYSDIRTQIELCKKICQEKNSVKIEYNKNNEVHFDKCTPKEVIYTSKMAYLCVYVPSKRENLEIPLNDIISIQSLPQVSNPVEMTMTVVYKLKGRLAKVYKPREHEQISYDSDQNVIIINKGEPVDILLHRLMRYMYNCEIISPKHLREKMQEMIEQTLKNYEE